MQLRTSSSFLHLGCGAAVGRMFAQQHLMHLSVRRPTGLAAREHMRRPKHPPHTRLFPLMQSVARAGQFRRMLLDFAFVSGLAASLTLRGSRSGAPGGDIVCAAAPHVSVNAPSD
ncbi:hypothetical protein SCP_0801290 [Sparassis crispa]|uniref:Uncharacterized protein n=1 Tax=Sparassis crispa TaxID=139825 RepID=A0A401GTQ4_9APHY|nr:hypothetical protein SCP_0801290 [Sparassis crispa]GBE85611.1 hypothetical protein SCP_0801290 [Sparassis crispa]